MHILDRAVRRAFAMIQGRRKLFCSQPIDRLTETEWDALIMFAGGRSFPGTAVARGSSAVTIGNTLHRKQKSWGSKPGENSSSGPCT